MIARYEKIQFNNFSKNNFDDSEGVLLDHDTKKIILGDLLEKRNLDGYGILEPSRFSATVFSDYIYFICQSENLELRRIRRNEASTLVFTFTTQFDELLQILDYKSKLIVIGAKNGDTVAYYSTNNGTSWTQSSNFPNKTIKSNKICDDRDLYLLFRDCLYKTSDFINFVLISNFSVDVLTNIIEEIDGIKFLSSFERNTEKVFLSRLENTTQIRVLEISESDIISDKKNIYYIQNVKGGFEIKKYNGNEQEKIGLIKSIVGTFAGFLGVSEDKIYFSVKVSPTIYYIYSINSEDEFILEDRLTTAQNLFSPFQVLSCEGAKFIFTDENGYEMNIYNNYNKKFKSSGNLSTKNIDTGEISCKQIIVRHRPLSPGTSVKVYMKKNYSSSWGSALFTSSAENSIKKKFTFTGENVIDFAQFKIELLTTDATKSPEDVELLFIFLPLGLENSK